MRHLPPLVLQPGNLCRQFGACGQQVVVAAQGLADAVQLLLQFIPPLQQPEDFRIGVTAV